MNVSRPHGRLIGALLTPIGRPTIVAAVLATASIFWWTAALPHAVVAMQLGLLGWLIVDLYRVLRFAARRIAAFVYRHPLRPRRRRIFMVLILLSGLMIWTRFPLRVLFWLGKPAMNRTAVYYYEKVPLLSPPPPPRFVGLIPVRRVVLNPTGVRFEIDDRTDLLYSPDRWRPYYEYRGWRKLDENWVITQDAESERLARPIYFVEYKWRQLKRHWR